MVQGQGLRVAPRLSRAACWRGGPVVMSMAQTRKPRRGGVSSIAQVSEKFPLLSNNLCDSGVSRRGFNSNFVPGNPACPSPHGMTHRKTVPAAGGPRRAGARENTALGSGRDAGGEPGAWGLLRRFSRSSGLIWKEFGFLPLSSVSLEYRSVHTSVHPYVHICLHGWHWAKRRAFFGA